jgi:formylglycine-generating enzyme required for sulfatase activity
MPTPVTVHDFAIGKYEVTQADWVAMMGNNPAHFQNNPEYPVEQVSWNDVQEFIRKLNSKLGETYRLPTEEEWEFAAKGGSARKDYRHAHRHGWIQMHTAQRTGEVNRCDDATPTQSPPETHQPVPSDCARTYKGQHAQSSTLSTSRETRNALELDCEQMPKIAGILSNMPVP